MSTHPCRDRNDWHTATSHTTRPHITIDQAAERIIDALFRGLDEGPLAARGGHR